VLRSPESHEAAPLHGSDSSPLGDAPVDLPLREERPALQQSPVITQRDLFAPSPPLASVEASGGRAGRAVAIWLMAAGSLIIGILIGFASGYSAGRRAEALLFAPPVGDTAARPSSSEDADNTFTEGTVAQPLRVDPEPIVTAPEASAVAEAVVEPVPAPGRTPTVAPRRVERASPPASAAAGRGSLQILSRPPGAQVTLDGRVIGRTPLVIPDVRTGRHDVRLELAGFRPWATSVSVDGVARTRVAASLEQ
jgi:hypothetical protein